MKPQASIAANITKTKSDKFEYNEKDVIQTDIDIRDDANTIILKCNKRSRMSKP